MNVELVQNGVGVGESKKEDSVGGYERILSAPSGFTLSLWLRKVKTRLIFFI